MFGSPYVSTLHLIPPELTRNVWPAAGTRSDSGTGRACAHGQTPLPSLDDWTTLCHLKTGQRAAASWRSSQEIREWQHL